MITYHTICRSVILFVDEVGVFINIYNGHMKIIFNSVSDSIKILWNFLKIRSISLKILKKKSHTSC